MRETAVGDRYTRGTPVYKKEMKFSRGISRILQQCALPFVLLSEVACIRIPWRRLARKLIILSPSAILAESIRCFRRIWRLSLVLRRCRSQSLAKRLICMRLTSWCSFCRGSLVGCRRTARGTHRMRDWLVLESCEIDCWGELMKLGEALSPGCPYWAVVDGCIVWTTIYLYQIGENHSIIQKNAFREDNREDKVLLHGAWKS